MNITFTGRHVEVTPAIKNYAEKKIEKFEKHFHQLFDVNVIMSVEKLDHIVELLINGDRVQFYAFEKSGDLYSSIDLLIDKMEKQIVKFKEKHTGHKAIPLSMVEMVETEDKGRIELDLNQVSNKPKDEVEAYLEMELEKRDFILFKKGMNEKDSMIDYRNKNYAVLYKNGNSIKMVEIPIKMIQKNAFDAEKFTESDFIIVNNSPTAPKIKLKKNKTCSDVRTKTLNEALRFLIKSNSSYLPFFNADTNYLNIIYKNGKTYEVMVPAF